MLDRTVPVEDQLLHGAASAGLRTRPPVGEEGEEVGDTDGAGVVEVPGAGRERGNRSDYTVHSRCRIVLAVAEFQLELEVLDREGEGQPPVFGECPRPAPS